QPYTLVDKSSGLAASDSFHRLLVRSLSPVFLRILRSPPCSTLFPYTTLFRSDIVGQLGSIGFYDLPLTYLEDFMQQVQVLKSSRDRKSTRLNSSHVKISYAVFCLINKNTHMKFLCRIAYTLGR